MSYLSYLQAQRHYAAIECHRRPNAETGLELDHSHLSRSHDLTSAQLAQFLSMELLRSSATRCRPFAVKRRSSRLLTLSAQAAVGLVHYHRTGFRSPRGTAFALD